jgi:hypothetical protein
LLLSVHQMGAAVLSVPELQLDKSEASQLAQAISEVAKYYNIEADEKTVAWVNLSMCGLTVYGTRALAYHNRMQAERRQRIPAPAAAPAAPAQTPAPAAGPRTNGAPAVPASALQAHMGMPPVGDL